MKRTKKLINQSGIGYWFGVIIFGLILGMGLQIAHGWVNPPANPPEGNVGAPINTSDATQYKSGALGIEGILATYSNGYVNGNLGVGTTAPSEKLEVNGNIKLSGDTPTYRLMNLADPTHNSDAATKAYVDAADGGGAAVTCAVICNGTCPTPPAGYTLKQSTGESGGYLTPGNNNTPTSGRCAHMEGNYWAEGTERVCCYFKN